MPIFAILIEIKTKIFNNFFIFIFFLLIPINSFCWKDIWAIERPSQISTGNILKDCMFEILESNKLNQQCNENVLVDI